MTLMQWIIIGVGGVLFLGGAVLLLIGLIKKKSLVLWKILPSVAIVCGLVAGIVTMVNATNDSRLTGRENYVACRLIELESYSPARLAAETAYARSSNVQSARLAVLSLALEGKYDQAEQAAGRYNATFGDSQLQKLAELSIKGAEGENVRADLLLIQKQIKAEISLSEGDREKAESIVNIQMQVSTGQYTTLSEDLENLAGESDPLSLKASAQGTMAQGDPEEAFDLLEQSALKDSSFPARAALAQMAANGYKRVTDAFGNIADSEQSALLDQAEKKNQEIADLQEQISQQMNENQEERERLEKQIADLEKEIEELYQEMDSVPVRRAVNYILAYNPSEEDRLAYDLTLAQLYFRSGEMEKAREYLNDAFEEASSGDSSGYLSLEFADLLEAYDNSLKAGSLEQMTESTEETEEEQTQPLNNDPNLAAQKLLSAMTQYTSPGDVTYSETVKGENGEETVETVSFSQFLLEALQEIRAGLHIGKIDTSNFPEISVTVNLSWQKKDQQRYGKDDFHVTEQGVEIGNFELVDTSEENVPPQVCLVMDHSGSMGGTNLEQAQKAVTSFIQTAGANMQTGLVVFDDTAETLCPVTESTGTVQRAVDNVTADGGTNISAGLLQGMNALENLSGNRIIILLSDGADSGESAAAMPSVINQLTQKGIVVYAVGFDFADSAYLSQICEATGGKFLRSETSEDLGSVYQTIEKFLTQDYVIRFTVQEDTSIYDREIRISLDDGVFDETDYFVGVSPERIEEEANLPPQSDFFQQTGGSGKEVAEP